LRKRARDILVKTTGASPAAAARALEESGRRLPVALLMLAKGISRREAVKLLQSGANVVAVLRELR